MSPPLCPLEHRRVINSRLAFHPRRTPHILRARSHHLLFSPLVLVLEGLFALHLRLMLLLIPRTVHPPHPTQKFTLPFSLHLSLSCPMPYRLRHRPYSLTWIAHVEYTKERSPRNPHESDRSQRTRIDTHTHIRPLSWDSFFFYHYQFLLSPPSIRIANVGHLIPWIDRSPPSTTPTCSHNELKATPKPLRIRTVIPPLPYASYIPPPGSRPRSYPQVILEMFSLLLLSLVSVCLDSSL